MPCALITQVELRHTTNSDSVLNDGVFDASTFNASTFNASALGEFTFNGFIWLRNLTLLMLTSPCFSTMSSIMSLTMR